MVCIKILHSVFDIDMVVQTMNFEVW